MFDGFRRNACRDRIDASGDQNMQGAQPQPWLELPNHNRSSLHKLTYGHASWYLKNRSPNPSSEIFLSSGSSNQPALDAECGRK